jgi:peptide/nickel transport system substrate-binding protein
MGATGLKILLGLTLVLALACGGAPAAPEPTIATVAEPTPVSGAGETSQPTATPQAIAPPAEAEVNPGKLTIMVGSLDNERFDRAFLSGPGGDNYGRIIGGFLISDNEKREMVPGIASDWNLSDDGLTWTFTIREGVKFHDGSELTPEDTRWTLQQYFGPQSIEYNLNSSAVTIARSVDRIELSGPDTVNVITKEPVATFASFVSEAGSGWWHIMPKRATFGDTKDTVAYDRNPIGAGFMRLVEHTPAQVMKFERFDDYYYQPDNGFPIDKRVKFRSLDMYLVPEEATRVAAIRAGDADIAPAGLPTKEQIEAGGGRMVFGQEGVYIWPRLLGCWEPADYPCTDKRVRQALDYAIDKELIRDQLYGGPEVFQVRGWNVVTPSTIGYTPALDPQPFDPDKARQLLADAGYPGGEGFGKLIVNTWPSSSTPFLVESAQLGAEFWRRELGLDVEVRVGDSVTLDEKAQTGELNGQILWRDNDTRRDATSNLASAWGDPTRSDRRHNDPELFQLVQETFQILDPEERTKASEELFLRLRDETYELNIGYINIPWGVGPRVVTWEPYPLAVYPSAFHTITLK